MTGTRLARAIFIPVVLTAALSSAAMVAGCASSTRAESATDSELLEIDRAVDASSTEVSVFYPSTDTILEEKTVLGGEGSPELQALRVLFAGKPRNPEFKATVPPATVRSVVVKDGIAWVDFSRNVLVTGASDEVQRVTLVAVIYTLKQFEGIERVAFTVEGRTSGSLGGKDVAKFWGTVTLKDMPWSVTTSSRSNAAKKESANQ
ncbi:MAG: GerMN domain-containing protein [Coriobacteriales bacterium]|nr:GerMN domain-containing protein [Coriobacteriales bacterium]